MMKTTTNNPVTVPAVLALPAPMTAEEIYTAAHIINHQVLSSRHKLTAQQIMHDMDVAQYHDQKRERLPELAAEHTRLESLHDELMQQAAELERIAARVTTPKAERDEASAQARAAKAQALNAQREADAIWTYITNSRHSDAADATQAAALEYWYTGNWAAAQRAAGRASNEQRKAAGLTNTRTEVRQITEEEYNAKRQQITITHKDGSTETVYTAPEKEPVKGKRGQDNGYITYEHRNSPRYNGYFAVWHRPAERAVIVYDSMDADSTTAATYTDNGGLNAVQDAWDAEAVQQMLTAANLTEQERRIVQRAAAIIMQTDAHTAHQYSAAWAKALRLCNVYAKQDQTTTQAAIKDKLSSTERSRIKRIKDKLSAAKAAQEQQQAAEEAAAAQTMKPLDLVAAMSRHAATVAPAAPVIKWTRRAYPQTVTSTTTAADRIIAADQQRKAAEEAARAAQAAKAEQERAEREAAERAKYSTWYAMEEAHKQNEQQRKAAAAEAAAEQEQRKAANARKLAAYNATLKATFAAMGTTYAKATEEQRNAARAAAQTAYDAAR